MNSGSTGATRLRVAVVGGGVIGLAVAWRCASAGAGAVDVVLIDPSSGLRGGASWVAGGMLAPVAEAHQTEESLAHFGMASMGEWPEFVADLVRASGADGTEAVGFTQRGTLVVARDGDDAAELNVLLHVQERMGCCVERLSSIEARRVEPALSRSVRGALWLSDDHQVDNRLLMAALMAAVERHPRIELHEAMATAVTPGSVSIRTEEGSTGVVVADRIVLCTGAGNGSSQFPITTVDGSRVTLPVRPVKGQILRVQGVASAVMPVRTVRGREVYVIPRAHGEIVIGATSEELGYDKRVTAGAVRELLDRAWEIVPGLAEATFVEAAAGLRPATPDNAPLLGRVANSDGSASGLFVATGHYRNGVLLAPITASIMADLVVHDRVDPWLTQFAPERFGSLLTAEVAA